MAGRVEQDNEKLSEALQSRSSRNSAAAVDEPVILVVLLSRDMLVFQQSRRVLSTTQSAANWNPPAD
jgi:hypothetical protein